MTRPLRTSLLASQSRRRHSYRWIRTRTTGPVAWVFLSTYQSTIAGPARTTALLRNITEATPARNGGSLTVQMSCKGFCNRTRSSRRSTFPRSEITQAAGSFMEKFPSRRTSNDSLWLVRRLPERETSRSKMGTKTTPRSCLKGGTQATKATSQSCTAAVDQSCLRILEAFATWQTARMAHLVTYTYPISSATT